MSTNVSRKSTDIPQLKLLLSSCCLILSVRWISAWEVEFLLLLETRNSRNRRLYITQAALKAVYISHLFEQLNGRNRLVQVTSNHSK